eukprot:3351192-Pyramimonas_sp.AAC.2
MAFLNEAMKHARTLYQSILSSRRMPNHITSLNRSAAANQPPLGVSRADNVKKTAAVGAKNCAMYARTRVAKML